MTVRSNGRHGIELFNSGVTVDKHIALSRTKNMANILRAFIRTFGHNFSLFSAIYIKFKATQTRSVQKQSKVCFSLPLLTQLKVSKKTMWEEIRVNDIPPLWWNFIWSLFSVHLIFIMLFRILKTMTLTTISELDDSSKNLSCQEHHRLGLRWDTKAEKQRKSLKEFT